MFWGHLIYRHCGMLPVTGLAPVWADSNVPAKGLALADRTTCHACGHPICHFWGSWVHDKDEAYMHTPALQQAEPANQQCHQKSWRTPGMQSDFLDFCSSLDRPASTQKSLLGTCSHSVEEKLRRAGAACRCSWGHSRVVGPGPGASDGSSSSPAAEELGNTRCSTAEPKVLQAPVTPHGPC